MKTVLGCLGSLVLFAALAYGIEQTAMSQVAAMWRPWLSIVAGALFAVGISNGFQLLTGYGQGASSRDSLIARATSGIPPDGGGVMVVTGRARPDGPLLTAPITGRPCVAYDYRIFEVRGRDAESEQTAVTWWGYACQPFVIDTGRRAVRVAAMPRLGKGHVDHSPDVDARLRRLVGGAVAFEPVTGIIGMASTLPAMFKDVVNAQGGGIRRDWHRKDSRVVDPTTQTLEESVLPADEEVSVMGYWSPDQQAIVPEPGAIAGTPVTAALGRARNVLDQAPGAPPSIRAVGITGVACVALGSALVWAAGAGYFAP
ncbi:MAG TPA: hypothetical protein VMF13_02515 [Luteitalea sp.]|nr:hypothetical protein [Luteitalea sp.]